MKLRRPGFTLIEVLISLVLLASALSISMRLAVTMTNRFQFSRDQVSKALLVKNKVLERLYQQFAEKFAEPQKLEDPPCTLVTEVKKVRDGSVLKEFAKDMKLVNVKAAWTREKRKEAYSLVGFLSVAPEKKKK